MIDPPANGATHSTALTCPPVSFTHHCFTCSTHQRRGGDCYHHHATATATATATTSQSAIYLACMHTVCHSRLCARSPLVFVNRCSHLVIYAVHTWLEREQTTHCLSGWSIVERNTRPSLHHRASMNAVTAAYARLHHITHCSRLVLHTLHPELERERSAHCHPLRSKTNATTERPCRSHSARSWTSNGGASSLSYLTLPERWGDEPKG